MKKILISILAMAIVLVSACSDDEKTATKKQFVFDGETVSLKDANLLLFYEGSDGNGHIFRDYFITDGTYAEEREGSGWLLTDYDDATYLLAVEVGTPEEEDLAAGEYPLYRSFSTAPATSNIGWTSFESDTRYYETPTGLLDGDPIVISGKFDGGNTMTIKFNGTLESNTEGDLEEVTGKYYFKGKVQDLRATLARKAKAAKGGKRN